MRTRRLLITIMTAIASFAVAAPTAQAGHELGADVSYPLVFPVQGPNTYGDHFWAPRANGLHRAVDIMADKMTPVVAAASGEIIWVGRNCCSLRILHDDGWSTTYIHLNNDTPGTDDGQGWGIAPGLGRGSRVTAGQLIGWVGDSGNAESTPPHLDFQLRDPDGVHVDPYESLLAAESGSPVAVSTTTSTSSGAACSVPSPGSLQDLTGSSGLIKRGARGTSVSQLQSFLNAIGHDVGSIDGVFGSKTLAGARQFQERQGLQPDGVIGPITRAAIARVAEALPAASALANDARVLRPGARGTDVRQIQQLLDLLGHDPGGVDGVLGPKTQTAIESFQRGAGLTVDGKIGPNTRGQLRAALGLNSTGCGN